jgi:hypothetical protein
MDTVPLGLFFTSQTMYSRMSNARRAQQLEAECPAGQLPINMRREVA